MVQPDTHAKAVDLALQPVDDAKKVTPPVGLSGKQHLAAEPGRRLEQNHLMSSFGADARRLHAGRPTADNEDLLPCAASDGEITCGSCASRAVAGFWMQ